jgi:TrmH family RNA methyltransferase
VSREPLHVTSTSNPRLKSAIALRDRKERERSGRILVEGLREISRALDAGLLPREVWAQEASPAGLDASARALLQRCVERGATPIIAAPHTFAKLALREGDSGVVSIFETPRVDAEATLRTITDRPALILAVHGVEKPGNLGALLRTADGAGVTAVVVLEGTVDLYAPQTIRASLGTVFTQPVLAMRSLDFRAFCERTATRIVAAALSEGARPPWELDLTGPTALLLGSEAHGLPAEWLADATLMQVPMAGAADSLNVAAAGAIALYEALRQRRRR